MQLAESSIYISLKQLRRKLRQCKFYMDKCERQGYDSSVMYESAMSLRHFVLAFTVKDKRCEHLVEMMGWFEVLKTDMDYYVTENIIHFRSKKDKKTGEIVGESTQKLDIFRLVAMIDEDVCKWWTSINKGRTLTE